jgi:hypothetical protein
MKVRHRPDSSVPDAMMRYGCLAFLLGTHSHSEMNSVHGHCSSWHRATGNVKMDDNRKKLPIVLNRLDRLDPGGQGVPLG